MLFQVIDQVSVPVEDPEGNKPADGNNKNFIGQRINGILQKKFPNMN